jgi:hypothetical protein
MNNSEEMLDKIKEQLNQFRFCKPNLRPEKVDIILIAPFGRSPTQYLASGIPLPLGKLKTSFEQYGKSVYCIDLNFEFVVRIAGARDIFSELQEYWKKYLADGICDYRSVLSEKATQFYSNLLDYVQTEINSIQCQYIGIANECNRVPDLVPMLQASVDIAQLFSEKTVFLHDFYLDSYLGSGFEQHFDYIVNNNNENILSKMFNIDFQNKIDIVPNYSDLNFWNYVVPDMNGNIMRPEIEIEYKVGCKYTCDFCTITYFSNETHKSLTTLEKELTQYVKSGISDFSWSDYILSYNVSDLIIVLSEIKQLNPYVSHSITFMPGSINRNDLEKLIDVGVTRINIGVETGCEILRNQIGKPFSNNQLLDDLDVFKNQQIVLQFIIGHPNEQEENFVETLDLVSQIIQRQYNVSINGNIFAHDNRWKYSKLQKLGCVPQPREIILSRYERFNELLISNGLDVYRTFNKIV